jgi:hypothetical protein
MERRTIIIQTRAMSKKPEPNDDGILTAEIASGHPTGGSHIPSDEKTTDVIIQSVLMKQWGIYENLHPLATGSTSRVWRTSNAIVKLARDEVNHFNAGLRASQAVEACGLEAGTPIRNRSGALSTRISVGNQNWMLAVLHHVKGTPTSLHEMTVRDVLDHMRQGMSVKQSISTRLMITSAIEAVWDWYRESNPRQFKEFCWAFIDVFTSLLSCHRRERSPPHLLEEHPIRMGNLIISTTLESFLLKTIHKNYS